MRNNRVRVSLFSAGITTGLILLAGCGGSAGSADSPDTVNGFSYGAPQDEVDEAVAGLEPVTLTLQPYASSASSPSAIAELEFMEAVTERSGGKIDFDVSWGQSIAPFSEVDDALSDGRLDIAYLPGIYDPAEYSRLDSFNRLSHYGSNSPMTGEITLQAQMSEAGWNDSELLDEYAEKGLIALNPLVNTGNYWAQCSSPHSTTDDWQGATVRIGGSVQVPIAKSIGSSPVSMAATESFEALERGTVDCSFVQAYAAADSGVLEVAPYVSVIPDQRFTGGVTSTHVAGPSFEQLPLPYQQIIFDAAGIDLLHGQMLSLVESNVNAVRDVTGAGGEFIEFETEIGQAILDTQEELVDQMISDGAIDETLRQELMDAAEKWEAIADDLGYSDGGELSEIDQWFDSATVDFRPLAEQVFESAAMAHRPE